jgi:hypothetical protein
MCGDSSKPEDLDRLLDGQPIHLVNTDPPYNVKLEPRSNNAIAAGLSSFTATQRRDASAGDQQSADLHRHPEKSRPTHRKLRAKDRPLANDFVSDQEFDRLLAAWFGNIARVLNRPPAQNSVGCANECPTCPALGHALTQPHGGLVRPPGCCPAFRREQRSAARTRQADWARHHVTRWGEVSVLQRNHDS